MTQNKVVAISSDIAECGKRVSDSKKKFSWKFKIADRTYSLSLLSSALSGKRKVYLDEMEIYSEKNVLNINFDFNHNIDGHNVRIFKAEESMNNYDLRIDNRSFEYLLKKKNSSTTNKVQKKASQFAAKEEDPFAEFAKCSKNKTDSQENNNAFGNFDDFDDFSSQPQPKVTAKKQKKNEQLMDFGDQKKQSLIEAYNFETNNNISNMEKNLCGNNEDLLSGDFSTNVYGLNNNYLDLIDAKGDFSDTFGQEPKKKTKIDQMKIDMTGKQIMNRTKMTAQIAKTKATDFLDSLI